MIYLIMFAAFLLMPVSMFVASEKVVRNVVSLLAGVIFVAGWLLLMDTP